MGPSRHQRWGGAAEPGTRDATRTTAVVGLPQQPGQALRVEDVPRQGVLGFAVRGAATPQPRRWVRPAHPSPAVHDEDRRPRAVDQGTEVLLVAREPGAGPGQARDVEAERGHRPTAGAGRVGQAERRGHELPPPATRVDPHLVGRRRTAPLHRGALDGPPRRLALAFRGPAVAFAAVAVPVAFADVVQLGGRGSGEQQSAGLVPDRQRDGAVVDERPQRRGTARQGERLPCDPAPGPAQLQHGDRVPGPRAQARPADVVQRVAGVDRHGQRAEGEAVGVDQRQVRRPGVCTGCGTA